MKKLILIIAVILFSLSCNSFPNLQFKTIQKGKFESTIVETGELEAVNSRIIRIPRLGWKYGKPKIVNLVDEGTVVKKGDFVAQLDASSISNLLQQQQNELEIARANLSKLKANHIDKIKQLEAQLVATESSYNLQKMQSERILYEPERKQKISRLTLEKAKISLDKLIRQKETTKIVHENEIKIQKLKIIQLENEIENSFRALKKTLLSAPGNGLVEYKINGRTDQKIRIGDELWPRAAVVGIPDLSRMKVKTSVDETDISKIFMGQKVIVRLDAFPRKIFYGRVTEIAKLSSYDRENRDQKKYSIRVLLENHDSILRPGMTVSCEFFIAELEDVFFIDNDCIFKENSRYFLCVKSKSSTEKREIVIGPQNNKFTVVYGDIKTGQPVLVNSKSAS